MRRRPGGHNLLEMVMAVLLFATVLVGLLSIWSTYSRAIGKARSVLVATYLGEQVMEGCIAAKYTNVDLFAASYPQTITTRAWIKGREVATDYVTRVATQSAGPDMKAIRVTVEWQEKTAERTETRSLNFNTMISRNS